MPFEQFVIAIVGIIFGTGLLGFAVARVTGLIKMWMQHRFDKPGSNEDLKQVYREFRKFQKNAERRLQNLEAIIADDNAPEKLSESEQKNRKSIEAHQETIDIEHREQREDPEKSSESGNLRNMLRS